MPLGTALVLMPLLLLAGCASWHSALPVPPEVTEAGVAERALIPPDLNVDPTEIVVKPGTPAQVPPEPPAPPGLEDSPTFTLTDAIAYGLRNSPRLRSARAAIERALGQEQAASASHPWSRRRACRSSRWPTWAG